MAKKKTIPPRTSVKTKKTSPPQKKKSIKKKARKKTTALAKKKKLTVTKKKKKKAPGRPTKYEDKKTVETIEAITDDIELANFFSWCGVENIAQFLNVHRDTVYEWRTKHPDFDTAMAKWETKRNAIFYTLCLKLNPAIWIFLAKNWLGLKDRFDFEGAMSSTSYQYVSHIPAPRKKPSKKEKKKKEKAYKEIEE